MRIHLQVKQPVISIILALALADASWASSVSEIAKLTASDAAAGDLFGGSAAVSGATMVVGAGQKDGNAGAVYVFVRSGAAWSQQQRLTASDSAPNSEFGNEDGVDISGDTLVVGAARHDGAGTDAGAAYVFVRSGATWSQQQKLLSNDIAATDLFGRSVAIYGDTVAVGAIRDDDHGTDSGAVYIFSRSGSAWTQQAKLTASDGAVQAAFGTAVSLEGDVLVVGAYGDAEAGANTGAAYIFRRNGTAWTQERKLTASDKAGGDHFGYKVALSGSTVAVGAYGKASNMGAAYVFAFDGSSWVQQQKLTASDAASGDTFGIALDIQEDALIVGARSDGDLGVNSGSFYVFDRIGTAWTQRAKRTASDGASGDSFGMAVGLGGTAAIVTSHLDDGVASNTGSAYVFEILDIRPGISSISPAGGPTAGGTTVTINGANFATGASVTFGGTAATGVSVNSATKITCTSPAHAAGATDVVVTNVDGQAASLAGGFTFNAPDNTNHPPRIDSGPTSSKSAPLESESVTFSASASDQDNDTLSYSWNFGDGTATAQGTSVSHAFAAQGTYTVALTVGDGKTSVSATLSQVVYSPTAPTITQGPAASPNPSVVGNQVLFSAQASNASGETITITWSFGDGGEGATGANATHVYAAAGSYTVTVTATDPRNSSSSATLGMTVTEQGGGGTESGTMTILKIQLKLNFQNAGRDMLMVQGTMDIPEGFNPDGMVLDVDVSSVLGSFVLDAKGMARTDAGGSKDKTFRLGIKFKKGVLVAGEAKFVMLFKKGDFSDAWRSFGLENGDVEEQVSIPISISTPTTVYADFLQGDYKATLNRMGQFVGKEGLNLGL